MGEATFQSVSMASIQFDEPLIKIIMDYTRVPVLGPLTHSAGALVLLVLSYTVLRAESLAMAIANVALTNIVASIRLNELYWHPQSHS